ncbi:unnamed protein product [Candida verbasci]|uniref:phosphoinositide 5-phosphatase n=1 Tax=Candida verbasci TaxID=1227364 RepID=A0A9W4U1R5_9ASCO|nr:unnamed protein product [Candida verbasci]
MKLLYLENPRILALYSDTYTLTFKYNKKLSKETNKPIINLDLCSNTNIKDQGYKLLIKREIFGCLGLIYIENQIFLAVITGAFTNVANPINNEIVNKIYSVDFISLNNNDWDFVDIDSSGYPILTQEEAGEAGEEARVQHPCFEIRKLLSNGSFYYSNDFDLTSLLQNRGFEDSINHYQPQYMWNSFLMDELIQFKSNLDNHNQLIMDDNKFLTTVIRGFAKTVSLGKSTSITIISKQSWKRAGTRYITRGIDDNGNVANFVETEFIYTNKSFIYSYTQIRGSVPTFWEQDSSLINPKITLTRSLEATQPVFNKHFSNVCQDYGVCHIIDLLSKTKTSESQISNRYRKLYENCNRKEEIDYTDFDFHYETKIAGGFAGATKILPQLKDSLQQFGYFSYDLRTDETITRQDGIFRVNCLDCLDRTNLIEQIICRRIFENILINQGIMNESFILKHNALWADNGDAISQIYTGTNALKSSFSRSGKMNIAGALSDVTKSVSRLYQNTFVDGRKQTTIDLLLGYGKNSKKVKIFNPASEYVISNLKKSSNLFTTYEDIVLFTGTFNVNALEPSNIDLTSWLFPPENETMPDVYAIGFQELIELNAGSILSNDPTIPNKWASIINQQLNSQNEQYVLLRTESISSMSLFLFAKSSKIQSITQVSGSSKKTGLGGMTANKGACAVRFEFGSTSFALFTSHLAAGTQALMERFNDYTTIMQGLIFTRNYSIEDHDHILWFGDLNYRINLPNLNCRNLIENGAFDELILNDQLTNERKNNGAFSKFNEGDIKFYPTYKFDKGTSNYDTSEKQRVPSWTDRILFMSQKSKRSDLEQLNYNSIMDICLSDHKPVYSTFKCKVEFINKEKKSNMAKDLYNKFRQENNFDLISIQSEDSISNNSPKTNNDDFTKDTLQDLNLLDYHDEFVPKLPNRPVSSDIPKRIPPPPISRRVNSSTEIFPRKLPPIEQNGITVRKVNSIENPAPTKISISSSPLIPTRSNSNSSSINNSNSSTPVQQAKEFNFKPMVPTKPISLTSNKLKIEEKEENKVEQKQQQAPPPPPPPRVTKSMADWKPLVPK